MEQEKKTKKGYTYFELKKLLKEKTDEIVDLKNQINGLETDIILNNSVHEEQTKRLKEELEQKNSQIRILIQMREKDMEYYSRPWWKKIFCKR